MIAYAKLVYLSLSNPESQFFKPRVKDSRAVIMVALLCTILLSTIKPYEIIFIELSANKPCLV